jgi:hypothetical protein
MWCAPVSSSLLGNPPRIRRKRNRSVLRVSETRLRKRCPQVAAVADFPGLFGFFLLIMTTLGAKTINACEIAGFRRLLIGVG